MEKKDIREEAFKQALESRKFEIDLYWRRTDYFFNVFLMLGGLSVLISVVGLVKKDPDMTLICYFLLVITECIGLVAAVAWLNVNRGSKYWQENWEQYVDELGKPFIGPLFRLPINEGGVKKLKRYSVSQINEDLSTYIVVLWSLFLFFTISLWILDFYSVDCAFKWVLFVYAAAVFLCTIIFICMMCSKSRLGKNPDVFSDPDPNISMYVRMISSIASNQNKNERLKTSEKPNEDNPN